MLTKLQFLETRVCSCSCFVLSGTSYWHKYLSTLITVLLAQKPQLCHVIISWNVGNQMSFIVRYITKHTKVASTNEVNLAIRARAQSRESLYELDLDLRCLFMISQQILHGILVYLYFYADANRLEPRSGITYVGYDLGSSLNASKTLLYWRI